MLDIREWYGHVHNTKKVNVVINVRRLSIADTPCWRVHARSRWIFFHDDVGYSTNKQF